MYALNDWVIVPLGPFLACPLAASPVDFHQAQGHPMSSTISILSAGWWFGAGGVSLSAVEGSDGHFSDCSIMSPAHFFNLPK